MVDFSVFIDMLCWVKLVISWGYLFKEVIVVKLIVIFGSCLFF